LIPRTRGGQSPVRMLRYKSRRSKPPRRPFTCQYLAHLSLKWTYEEHPSRKQRIRHLFKTLPIDQRPRSPRMQPSPHEQITNEQTRKLNKRQRPHGPPKSNLRKKLLHQSREHHASRRAPRSHNPKRQRPPLAEISTDQAQ